MKKFTDEEVSRILTAHEANFLFPGGAPVSFPDQGCINQYAYNESNIFFAYNLNKDAGEWFDGYYNHKWTVKEFVNKLTKEGFI